MEDTARIRILAVKIKIRSGFMKNFKGFSLAEMMIVLLIISITLAATAPMITRKITKTRSQDKDNNEQVFRPLKSDPKHVAEYAKGLNQRITMGGPSEKGFGITTSDQEVPRESVIIGRAGVKLNSAQQEIPDLVAIGFNSEIHKRSIGIGLTSILDTDAIAIGAPAHSNSRGGIAIGTNSIVNEDHKNDNDIEGGIAIGLGSIAQQNSITLGRQTRADNTSIAIGNFLSRANKKSISIGNNAQSGLLPAVHAPCLEQENFSNIAIGDQASAACNSIAIGNNTVAPYKNSVIIGNSGHSNGLPAGQVSENAVAIGNRTVATNNAIAIGYQANAVGENSIAIGTNVNASENHSIVIGTSEDTVYIHGRLVTDSSRNSDIRLKNLGNPYTDGLDALNKLKFYHYTFKKDKAQTPHVGVIAQELQKVFPNAVTKGSDGYLQIRLEDMFYAAINAIKELNTKVITLAENMVKLTEKTDKQQEELTAQAELINIQQQKIDELTARLEKLEKRKK